MQTRFVVLSVVAGVLSDSQAATDRGAAASRKVESDFQQIARDIGAARELLQQANATTDLQSAHVKNIVESLREIKVATSENAVRAGHFAEFTQTLGTQTVQFSADAEILTGFLGQQKTEARPAPNNQRKKESSAGTGVVASGSFV